MESTGNSGNSINMQAAPLHNAWALGWASFFTDVASSMVTVLLPIFVLQVLGESPAQLGLVVAVGTFVSFALRWVAGWLSDVSGRPKLLAATGYSLSALAKPLLALTATWDGVAALRALERTGKAMRSAPRDALLARSRRAAARAFGLHKAMDLGGEATGLVLVAGAFWLAATQAGDLVRVLLLATAVPGVFAIAVVWLAVREAPASARRGERGIRLGRIGRGAFTLALFLLVVVDQPLLIGRLAELDVSVPAISAIVFAGHLLSITVALFLGKRLTGQSDAGLTGAAVSLNLAALVILATASAALPTALAVLAMLTAQSAIMIIARTRIAREGRTGRGAAFGSFYLVVAVAAGAAAWAGGAIWARFGFPALAAALAAINLAFVLPLAVRPWLARTLGGGR